MDVVENHGDKPLRQNGGLPRDGIQARRGALRAGGCHHRSSARFGRFHAERRNRLELLVVVELEVFLLETGHDLALRVANHHAYQHEVHAHLKRCWRVAAGDFLAVAGCRSWRGRLSIETIPEDREAKEENYQTEAPEPQE